MGGTFLEGKKVDWSAPCHVCGAMAWRQSYEKVEYLGEVRYMTCICGNTECRLTQEQKDILRDMDENPDRYPETPEPPMYDYPRSSRVTGWVDHSRDYYLVMFNSDHISRVHEAYYSYAEAKRVFYTKTVKTRPFWNEHKDGVYEDAVATFEHHAPDGTIEVLDRVYIPFEKQYLPHIPWRKYPMEMWDEMRAKEIERHGADALK